MKAVVTGAAGQLGRELLCRAPGNIELRAATRDVLDITDSEAVNRYLAAEQPDVLFNAAGYTGVDQAEREPQQAQAANTVGPQMLASACARLGVRLIHISSDYVFDGLATEPYRPSSTPAPLSAYGRSKREGEVAVLAANPRAVVLRSAWLYSARGHGFVQAILARARAGQPLRVVADQVGSPTWAAGLATVMWRLATRNDIAGILHHADAGRASWHEFALAIVEEAAVFGILPKAPPVEPVTSLEYGAPARRPAFSVLDSSETRLLLGDQAIHWRTNLRLILQEMPSGNV
jgi:dTDP-4-dehydrorhamnose reductase